MTASEKILTLELLPAWRCNRSGIVATNGAFDLLHIGHVKYLESAKSMAKWLIVGVNSDDSVRQLKGPSRPVNSEWDRAYLVASLQCVDAVVIFDSPLASPFLLLAAPQYWVKGGDYTPDILNPQERAIVEKNGGAVVILPLIPNHSTSRTISNIKAQ